MEGMPIMNGFRTTRGHRVSRVYCRGFEGVGRGVAGLGFCPTCACSRLAVFFFRMSFVVADGVTARHRKASRERRETTQVLYF